MGVEGSGAHRGRGRKDFGAEDMPADENICPLLSAQTGWREEKAQGECWA